MLTCYLDESGTDNNSEIAVVGGVVINMSQYYYLNQEWNACLKKHDIPWPLHMKEFGAQGTLAHIRSEDRRALFTDVARVMTDNITYSVAATMTSQQYRETFKGISKLSMYGACFVNVAMLNGSRARIRKYKDRIAYLLDTGNPHSKDIHEAHASLLAKEEAVPLNVGAMGFDSDNNHAELQMADIVAWSTRRRLDSKLGSGFEPLEAIFDGEHFEADYKPEWMGDVAKSIRAKLKP